MAQQLPLDVVSTSTCSGAYAVYRVSSSYVGATVNVRRSSDNATTDFYANAYGQLGTSLNGTGTSIETWLGSSTGYVVKWYDQSGRGNHATQSDTSLQPRIDNINNRIDFTVSSGTAHLLLPSGTVPNCRTYSVSGYISTNSAARTVLVSDNNILQNIYDNALTATVQMNGSYIGSNVNAYYLIGSRTDISLTNEFSVIYCIFDSSYTKAARVVFRQNGSTIDCYQSQGLNWNSNVTGTYYNTVPITDANVPTGGSGYGVSYISIVYKTSYTVTVKHNTIGNATGTWLGSAGTGVGTNLSNAFRRDSAGYLNYWFANDFPGNANTYAAGNIVTHAFDGNYNYLYINGTPQGVSAIRTGWNGQSGNEYIGKSYFNEYLNGELYSLFIFKSLLSTNERTSIEKTMPLSSASGPISFSKLKTALGLTTSSVSMSQAQMYAVSGSAVSVSAFNGYILRNGLFMRIYWNRYHNNDVNFFNNNTPNITGVTTNLRNTYCTTGGFNNSNIVDIIIGNVPGNTVYSVECVGLFFAPVSGTYTFYLASDDSSYLWIGSVASSGYTTSNCLINNFYIGPAEKSATISLTGGTYYPFRLQFGDSGGGEFIICNFAPPNGGRVYDGTGYFFCQSINNPNSAKLSVYYPFEIPDVNISANAVTNKANSSSNAILYNGATMSNTVFKQGSSSLSLTAASSQYALSSNFTPTTNGLTISFWYKSNGSPTWARVFDFGNGPSSDNIFISSNGDGLNRFVFSVFYGATENKIYLTDANYNDNVWRHIVWTLTYATPNSYTSTWNLYINGVNRYNSSTQLYPSPSVTRTLCYLGRSNWAGDGYYNGNIDEFRIYDSVLNATDAAALYNNTMVDYTYTMLNGSTSITTTVQGMSSTNPATSGYAIYSANPWLPNGYYWIKSAAMPNALQMFVDIKNGGQDFYQIVGGTSVNYITQTHSGTALGLELLIPRSQDSWRAIDSFIHKTLNSNYSTWFPAWPVYKTTSGGNYTGYAMFDPRLGNSGSTAGSYNGAPDWRCKDGGVWYLRDVPFYQPDGDYIANAFLGIYYTESAFPWLVTLYGATGFNDGYDGYFTGSTYIVSTNYAGSTLTTLYDYFDGSTAARAAPSALYIKNRTGTNTNGVYWINLPTVGATQVYCIMDSAVDGGGWMMAMKATKGTTFNYDSTHWTTATTLNPSDNTRNDADAKFHSMNYFQGKDMLALWPDITTAGGSLTLSGYNNWCWMKNNYNSGSRQALINYFSIVNNVSFGTPKGVERGTAFSSQGGNSFYGANFTSNYTYRVRWGLAWNNEGDWYSNDAGGGIGMSAGSYSAGDYIGCCVDQTGINRTARVEVYVR